MMTLKMKDTEELKQLDERYKNCDGRCDKCIYSGSAYRCCYLHEKIVEELKRRGEYEE